MTYAQIVKAPRERGIRENRGYSFMGAQESPLPINFSGLAPRKTKSCSNLGLLTYAYTYGWLSEDEAPDLHKIFNRLITALGKHRHVEAMGAPGWDDFSSAAALEGK